MLLENKRERRKMNINKNNAVLSSEQLTPGPDDLYCNNGCGDHPAGFSQSNALLTWDSSHSAVHGASASPVTQSHRV